MGAFRRSLWLWLVVLLCLPLFFAAPVLMLLLLLLLLLGVELVGDGRVLGAGDGGGGSRSVSSVDDEALAFTTIVVKAAEELILCRTPASLYL
jgi:hypothetical protein